MTNTSRKNEKHDGMEFFILLWVVAIVAGFFFVNVNQNPSLSTKEMMGHFFGADCWRALENIKNTPEVSHYRDKVHPFFSIFAVSISNINEMIGVPGIELRIYTVIFGGGACTLFWMFLYRNTDARTSLAATALLFSTLTIGVWSRLPETFLFGFFTLMVGLNLMDRKINPVAVTIASMAGTITNASLGLIYAATKIRSRPALLSFFVGVAFAAALISVMQKILYPTSDYFFNMVSLQEEKTYIVDSVSALPFRFYDFIVSGFLIPAAAPAGAPLDSKALWADFAPKLFSGTKIAVVALVATTMVVALFLTSVSSFLFRDKIAIQKIISLFLCFQLALHMVYGDTPFLYSLHFTPMLIIFFAICHPKKMSKYMPFVFLMLAILLQNNNRGALESFGLLA